MKLLSKFYFELSIAIVLFIIAISTNSMVSIIINLLYFIIVLEIVRAVVGFLREQKIKMWILIDAFIVLTLRELIVNVVKINKETITSINDLLANTTMYHIFIFSGVILFLFLLRWLAMVTSPDKKNK
jgi:uncharacterized membrane protein (DUF373 family)